MFEACDLTGAHLSAARLEHTLATPLEARRELRRATLVAAAGGETPIRPGDVLWLAQGIEGDDTDGHIDDLARFTDDTTIVACTTDVAPNRAVLEPYMQYNLELRDGRIVAGLVGSESASAIVLEQLDGNRLEILRKDLRG